MSGINELLISIDFCRDTGARCSLPLHEDMESRSYESISLFHRLTIPFITGGEQAWPNLGWSELLATGARLCSPNHRWFTERPRDDIGCGGCCVDALQLKTQRWRAKE
ncbi:unnamed protein product [Boreogadus saida]